MGKKIDKINLEIGSETFTQMFNDRKLDEFREAVVHVKPGESKEEAWARHLFDHPQDANAIVKIFIIPDLDNSRSR